MEADGFIGLAGGHCGPYSAAMNAKPKNNGPPKGEQEAGTGLGGAGVSPEDPRARTGIE